MTKETIIIGKEKHDIEVKPLTLICPGANLTDSIKYPKRLKIDFEASIYHIERVQKFHDETRKFIRQVFKIAESVPLYPDQVRKMGDGIRHFAGRIDLSLKLIQMKVPFVWVYPEACIYPANQAEMADVAIELSKR